ncbi:MAG: hypothetical protein V3S55_15535 [Nitrospiraceae bacterium]
MTTKVWSYTILDNGLLADDRSEIEFVFPVHAYQTQERTVEELMKDVKEFKASISEEDLLWDSNDRGNCVCLKCEMPDLNITLFIFEIEVHE